MSGSELRLGHGTLARTIETSGNYLLVVAERVRESVLSTVARPPAHTILAETLDLTELTELFAGAPPVDHVVGVGGGLAIDAAKYGAQRIGAPLISVPTILSTTAYVNPLAVLRDDDRSVMLDTVPAAVIVIDFEILRRAPKSLNVAGLGDVLSCHTATYDWRVDADNGTSVDPWDPAAARQAQLLIQTVAAHAAAFRSMQERALKILVDLHIEVVALCAELGHERPERGPEHDLVEMLEEVTGRSFLHGPIVALGIDVMSELQGNDHDGIRAVMDSVELVYSPNAVGVNRDELDEALRRLATVDNDRIGTLLDRRFA